MTMDKTLKEIEKMLQEAEYAMKKLEDMRQNSNMMPYLITYDFDTNHSTYKKRYSNFHANLTNNMKGIQVTESSYLLEHNGNAQSVFSQVKADFRSSDSCFVIQVVVRNRFLHR